MADEVARTAETIGEGFAYFCWWRLKWPHMGAAETGGLRLDCVGYTYLWKGNHR